MKIRNLEKINDIYKITAYGGSNFQYFTFCTPECASYIDTYQSKHYKMKFKILKFGMMEKKMKVLTNEISEKN